MSRKNIKSFVCVAFGAALGLFASGNAVHAAPLASGTVIGIDFGPTAPGNDYNQVDGNATITGLHDLNGTLVDNVGFTLAGVSFSNTDGTSQDLANYPAFLELADANTTDFAGFYPPAPFTLTFSGLDNSLSYNFYGIASFDGRDLGVTFSSGSKSDLTVSNSATGETMAQLTGLTTDGSGNLIVTVNSVDVPVVNAIALQAVPEPASLTLFGLGAFGLLARRRR